MSWHTIVVTFNELKFANCSTRESSLENNATTALTAN